MFPKHYCPYGKPLVVLRLITKYKRLLHCPRGFNSKKIAYHNYNGNDSEWYLAANVVADGYVRVGFLLIRRLVVEQRPRRGLRHVECEIKENGDGGDPPSSMHSGAAKNQATNH